MKRGTRILQERTLAIIKPDAFSRNMTGQIIAMAEAKELSIIGAKLLHLTEEEARGFYRVHREKGFFDSLTQFMSEGPIMVLAFQGENAITRWRETMGATNPSEAEEGTIRAQFGEDIERNAVHGSDSSESSSMELSYFFNELELIS
jgi:nucleoside-diphosphate kinase